MGLKKYNLGEPIELSEERTSEDLYSIENVRDIFNEKEIVSTNAKVDGSVIRKFHILRHNQFIYNPRTTQMGDIVDLSYNNTDNLLLFSFNNIAFSIKNSAKELMLPQYLYMYFNRSEFDRFVVVYFGGNDRETFTWKDLKRFSRTLPPLDFQRTIANIYKCANETKQIAAEVD